MKECRTTGWMAYDSLQSDLWGPDVLRAGIIFSWAECQHGRPPIEFFHNHSIPMFFPWSIKEEQLIDRDSSLSYLRPPNELIQEALSFLSKSPQSLPLAAFIMKCFFREDYDGPLNKETLFVLDPHSASSFVLNIMKDLFLAQYSTLTGLSSKPGGMDQLADAIAAITEEQHRAAEAAASAPRQINDKEGASTSWVNKWCPIGLESLLPFPVETT